MTDIITLTGLIFGIVGAFVWIPVLIDKCKFRKIYTKVLSVFCNPGMTYAGDGINIFGSAFFIKMVLLSANKNLLLKSVKGVIKFPMQHNCKNIHVFYQKDFTRTVSVTEKYKLNVSASHFLQCQPFFVKDENHVVYFTFIVDGNTPVKFEYIDLYLETHTGKTISHRISSKDIGEDDVHIDPADFVRL